MRNRWKIILIAAAVLLSVTALVIIPAAYFYLTAFRVTDNAEYTSPHSNGTYTLQIKQIGEPVFPFGPVKGRLLLYKDGKLLSKHDFVQHNDGAALYIPEENVQWEHDRVRIQVVSETGADTYTVMFASGGIAHGKRNYSVEGDNPP